MESALKCLRRLNPSIANGMFTKIHQTRPTSASIKIQSLFRGYMARKAYFKKLEQAVEREER